MYTVAYSPFFICDVICKAPTKMSPNDKFIVMDTNIHSNHEKKHEEKPVGTVSASTENYHCKKYRR